MTKPIELQPQTSDEAHATLDQLMDECLAETARISDKYKRQGFENGSWSELTNVPSIRVDIERYMELQIVRLSILHLRAGLEDGTVIP